MDRISNLLIVDDEEGNASLKEDWICTLEELERRHVERVLEHVRGNKAAAARILGIERKTLYRMLDRWAV